MGSISVEMWRGRIGRFPASICGMNRKCVLASNSRCQKWSMIFAFILGCVNLYSTNPLTRRNQPDTANYPDVNEKSTHCTSNETSIDFQTTHFNVTTPPTNAGGKFFDTFNSLVYCYFAILAVLSIIFNGAIHLFEKYQCCGLIIDGWIRNRRLDYLPNIIVIFSNMNVILSPITIIGILLPWNSWVEITFRYFIDTVLLLIMSLFLMCMTIVFLIRLRKVCIDTTNFKIDFHKTLRRAEEKSTKFMEILIRLIIVMIRIVIKITLGPISFICKKFRLENVRTDGGPEGTIKANILFYYNVAVKTLKRLTHVTLNFWLWFFVIYQNDRKFYIVFFIVSVVGLIIWCAASAIFSILRTCRLMRKEMMNTQSSTFFENFQANGDFDNGNSKVNPDHCKRLQSVIASINSNSTSFSMVRHDKASDSLCKCRLRLGSSETYKRLVKTHQASDAKRKNSPENVFITARQKQLLKTIESEEKRNYERIVNGEVKELVVSPSVFQFNRKIGVHETIEQHTLQDVALKMLSQNPNEAKEINSFLKDIKWQIAEWDIFSELAIFFSQKQGLLVNGYETQQFIKPFVREAEDYRKQNIQGVSDLTDMEKQILKALNIDEKKMNDAVDSIVNELVKMYPGPNFLTSNIHSEIIKSPHRLLTKDAKAKSINKFKQDNYPQATQNIKKQLQIAQNQSSKIKKLKNGKIDKSYTADEIRSNIKFSIYQAHSKYASEWDFLVIIPSSKTIVNVEVKNNANTGSGKNSNLVSASDQLEKHAFYFAEKHGYFIGEGWSFVKIAAIKPHVDNKTLACSNCERFIITNEHHIGDVWKSIQFSDFEINKNEKKNLQNDFITLFRRLVSYSSVARTSQPKSLSKSWEQVQGDSTETIKTGYTKPHPSCSVQPTFSEIRQMAHDAYKTIYFNPEQFGLLFGNSAKRLVVLFSDFGTGKTLITKEKAVKEAEQSGCGLVFFISLVASDQMGFAERYRFIFDILSENYDFQGTNVQFYDVNRLWEEYLIDYPNAKWDQVDVFELAKHLISRNQRSSFILDEVPICKERGSYRPTYTAKSIKRTKDFLLDCINSVQNPNIFWAALQANCLSDVVIQRAVDLSEPIKELKQSLISAHVHVGTLSVNMRNTREIHELKVMQNDTTNTFFSIGEVRTNVVMDHAKPTTVVGAIPTVFSVKNAEFSGSVKEILRNCLNISTGSTKQSNTVILHDDSISTDHIKNSLKDLNSFTDVVSYPSSDDPHTCQDGLDRFLRDENIALVTHEMYFRGCETKNVVYFCENGENVRSSTARAVENLIIVQKLVNEYQNGLVYHDNHIFRNCHPKKFLSHPNPFYRLLNRLENWTSNIF